MIDADGAGLPEAPFIVAANTSVGECVAYLLGMRGWQGGVQLQHDQYLAKLDGGPKVRA